MDGLQPVLAGAPAEAARVERERTRLEPALGLGQDTRQARVPREDGHRADGALQRH